jgi:putative hemolysin
MVLIEAKRERPVDVQAGSLHIRLAESAAEIRASQRLRYRVFCEEMMAKPSAEMVRAGREFDSYDDYCDHLLVLDRGGGGAVVGSYRLMRREAALRRGQFYAVDEYDITPLLNYPGEILELGRSCVDPAHRTGSTMQLLWRGIAEYVFAYNIDLMFGCGSLPGTDPQALALPLSYLYHHHLAPPALRATALSSRYVAMDLLPSAELDLKVARKALPPLLKGYLRLGGYVGDGAVVDAEFGTTDVCIVVKTDLVTERYYRHYTREDASRSEGGS